jgi:hypothetical protein
MVNDGDILSRFLAVFAREHVAHNQLNIFVAIELIECILKPIKSAATPDQASDVAITVFQKDLDDFSADKTIGSGYQNQLIQWEQCSSSSLV